jgi:hypothetical protein
MSVQLATQANYDVDTTNLPSFDKAGFVQAVNDVITGLGIPAGSEPVLRDGIIGMLLLDGNSDQTAPSFGGQIRNRLWTYVQSPLVDSNGVQIGNLTNKDAFNAVDAAIQTLRASSAGSSSGAASAGGASSGGASAATASAASATSGSNSSSTSAPSAYYQELATASRQIIDGQRGAIINNPILLNSAVQASLQNYGSGTTQGSFELPPLTGPTTGGGTDEIIPDHIRSVGMHVAAYQLEVVGLWQALQRSLEIFMVGQLPVGMSGVPLNAYYWDQINQMTESARWMQYTRVLGVEGGEVSKDVQPNKSFMTTLTSFVSSLSEYDRQQRVADMLGNTRGLSLTGEHVRKVGRDLAANCTLFGYGYTQFAAKKLQTQIQTALNIFKLSDFQAAWGVQTAWQAVQRIMSQEFHKIVNINKQTTLAKSQKALLDLVADHADAWSGVSGRPLFDVVGSGIERSFTKGDISDDERIKFTRNAEFILAVQGNSDAEVTAAAAPKPTEAIASIPSLDGSAAPTNGHNADIAGQIQQMLSQNQTPNPDQLRKMIGV